MRSKLLLVTMVLLAWRAEGADLGLPAGARIRLKTGTPAWTEKDGVRQIPGHTLREDEDSVTFQPMAGGEPATRTKAGRWLTGHLVGVDDRELTVRLSTKGDVLKIPVDVVSRIEVSSGPGRLQRGLVGAGVGGVSLAALAALPDPCPTSKPSENPFDGMCLLTRRDAAIVAGIGGAVLGAIVGLAHEKWRPISLRNTSVRLSVAPAARGGAVAMVAVGF
jgi:hypothetical protein